MKLKNILSTALIASTMGLGLQSCYTNPVTGRSSLNLIDEGTVQQMASQQYTSFLATNAAANGTKDAEMVQRTGQRISAAVNTYLSQRNQLNLIQGYKWEFNLVNNNEVNAWCMPGGKVVVYTGILPIAQNEAGLAVIMGHEIAHAIARHGNERMSQGLVQQLGGVALSVALSSQPAQTQNLFLQSYGIGSTLGILGYSRKHESEADGMGLIFMAMAGYNPNEAVPFWQRMAAKGGQKPPEFLSTHPSDATRIRDIQAKIPEAMKYYKPQ